MPIQPGNFLSDSNCSFEDGTGDWVASNVNTTVAQSAVQAYHGPSSLQFTATAAGVAGVSLTGVNAPQGLNTGRNYRMSYWLYASDPGITASADIDWYASNVYQASAPTVGINLVINQWTNIQSDALTPAPCDSCALLIKAVATAPGQIFYADMCYFGDEDYAGGMVSNTPMLFQ